MKKITSLFLSLILLLNIVLTCQISSLAATATGTYGENLAWSLNTDTGELTISGTGEMKNVASSSDMPWASYNQVIKSVTVKNGVTSIGNHAFGYCSSLKSVSLPNSLTTIGDRSFTATAIETITIPKNVEIIRDSFVHCENLKSIYVEPDNETYKSIGGVLFENQRTSYPIYRLLYYPNSKKESFYSVPCDTTCVIVGIAPRAFDCNKYLKNVEIKNCTLMEIGNEAFANCRALNTVSVSGIAQLYPSAFENCSNLTYFNCECYDIGQSTFSNCVNLKNVTITRSVETINQSAFENCTSLSDVNYLGTEDEWKNVTVEDGNDALLSATINYGTLDSSPDNFVYSVHSDGTVSITDYVGNATEIVIPSKIDEKPVTDIAFYGISADSDSYKNILSVTIPSTVTKIDTKAFRFFKSLEEIKVDNNNPKFTDKLEYANDIFIPGLLVSKDGTDLYCLPSKYPCWAFDIPKEIDYVEDYAFYNCRFLIYLSNDHPVTYGGTDIINKANDVLKIHLLAGSELQVNAIKYGIPYETLDTYAYRKQSNGFDLKKDGYCFINSGKAFSYPNNYKIPYDVYRSVFGNSYTHQQYKSVGKWGGNCFGMSATAALFEKKKLDFSTYSSGTVNSYYDSYDWLREILKLKSKSKLLRLIEQYQVWQDSQEANDVITSLNKEAQSFAGLFLKVIDIVNKTKEPLMMGVSWDKEDGKSAGHALVVDTSRAPTDLGGNTWRLYLYDPNSPYSDSNKQLNASVYSEHSNRYIDLNVVSGEWKMTVSTNADGSPCEIGTPTVNNKKEDTIAFFSTEDMTRNVDSGKATLQPSKDDNTTCMNISADDVSVKDESGNAVFTVQDGKIDYISNSAKFSVNCGYVDDVSTELTGKLYLPENTYVITFTKSGTVQILNSDYFVGVVAQPNTQFTVDNAGNVDCLGISVTNADANIVIERTESDRYTSVETDVSVSKDKQVNLSLNKDDNYSVTGDDTVDTINVVSSKTNNIEYKISDYNKYESDFDDITDLASEKGEKTTPECKHSTTEVRNKKSPSCTASGYTGDTVCAECETVVQIGTSIAPLGHSYKSYVTKATFSRDGTAYKKCTVCGTIANKSALSRVSVVKLAKTSYVYDKKSKKPSLVVKDSKGNTLKNGRDYSVTYPKSCKNVGKYKVTVILKGNYSGTKTLIYEIRPKGTSITKLTSGKGKFTAKIAKQKTQTTGYEIQYSTSKKFKGAKKVTLKNSATSKTVKKLKRNKKYYVRVRTYKKSGKTTCYSSWSKTKTIKIK